MSTHTRNELQEFQHFLIAHINGAQILSPEEALDLWRRENPQPSEYTDTVAALQEAIADMENGDRGIPLADFDAAFRQRIGTGRS